MNSRQIDLHIPWITIFRMLGAAVVVYLCVELSSLIVTLFLATMIAVTLYPARRYLLRHMPPWAGIVLIAAGMVLGVGLLMFLIVPPLLEQCTLLVNNLPQLQRKLMEYLPDHGPLRHSLSRYVKDLTVPDPVKLAPPLLSAGQIAIGGLTQFFLVLIFSVYLLADGPRAVDWVLAFFSDERRKKLQQTAYETSKVISAYVSGQVITSVICGIYTFIVLSVLDVPGTLTLAVLAGVFDVLPVLGFFLAAIPAALMGLTISPVTALMVVACYVVYHAIENYLLVPKIYGNRLRLSDLVVLVSLIAGATFGGIIGAIAILPLVASYPIIERIWLVNVLGRSVVKKHAAADAAQDQQVASSTGAGLPLSGPGAQIQI